MDFLVFGESIGNKKYMRKWANVVNCFSEYLQRVQYVLLWANSLQFHCQMLTLVKTGCEFPAECFRKRS